MAGSVLEEDTVVPWPAAAERLVIVEPLLSAGNDEEPVGVASGVGVPNVTVVAVSDTDSYTSMSSSVAVLWVRVADHSDRLLASAAAAEEAAIMSLIRDCQGPLITGGGC